MKKKKIMMKIKKIIQMRMNGSTVTNVKSQLKKTKSKRYGKMNIKLIVLRVTNTNYYLKENLVIYWIHPVQIQIM